MPDNEVATIAPGRVMVQPPELLTEPAPWACVFGSAEQFDLGQRMARALASSDLVPTQYRDKLANCLIALDIAMQRRISPLMVMQNMAVIQGRPAWSAQFIIASINACGLFSPLRYEWRGQEGTDQWGCRAYAHDARNGERLDGSWITIGFAKAEGWYGRAGSKWQTMPEQMLRYRAGSFFGRIYAGHITLGLPTIEEVVDQATTAEQPLLTPNEARAREQAPPLNPPTGTAALEAAVIADTASRMTPAARVDPPPPAEPRRRRRSAAEPAPAPAPAPVANGPRYSGAPPAPIPDSGLEPAPPPRPAPAPPADTVVDTDPF